MADFTILATNHTSFTVSDMSRSLAFWRDVMGFTVTEPRPVSRSFTCGATGITDTAAEIAFVTCPGHHIELLAFSGTGAGRKIRARPSDIGFAHIAFDVQGIAGVVERLLKAGWYMHGRIQAIESGPRSGGRLVYMSDQDGVTIEFIELHRA